MHTWGDNEAPFGCSGHFWAVFVCTHGGMGMCPAAYACVFACVQVHLCMYARLEPMVHKQFKVDHHWMSMHVLPLYCPLATLILLLLA